MNYESLKACIKILEDLSRFESLKMIFQWVKTNRINTTQFQYLIDTLEN